MSIDMSIMTPSKEQIAEILKRIADLIVDSANETVTVQLHVTFNRKDP